MLRIKRMTSKSQKGSSIQKGSDVDKLTKAFATTQGELHKLQKQLQDITQVVGQWAQVQATGFQAYASAPSQGNNYQGQGVGVGVKVYHIHLTKQIISNLVKIEGDIVLPDINLKSKEV